MKTLVIWGCGGHGRVVLDIAIAMLAFDEILFYDDNPDASRVVSGLPVMRGGISAKAGAGFVIAIGNNRTRAERFQEAFRAGLFPATCVHPTAWISPSAAIGAGTVVMPKAVVQADTRVGVDCIVNTAVVVEHDCVVCDHVHLSPATVLGGGVTVGEFAHLGIGSIAIPGATIGRGAIVGAGAVVLKRAEAEVTVVGVPARPLKKR